MLEYKAAPVFCGSSLRNKGVQPLLDAVIDYLPSPLDVPAVRGIDPKTEKELVHETSNDEPLCALMFKIVSDPYAGRMAYFRVYSVKVVQGAMALNPTSGKERIGRLLRVYADHREDVEKLALVILARF